MDTHESRRTYAEGRFSAPQTAVWGLALALVFGFTAAACKQDADDKDGDTKKNPIRLTAGTWADGNIAGSSSGGSGEQWFSFTATASTQYIHMSYGSMTSMYIQLYDLDDTPVGSRQFLHSYTSGPYARLTQSVTYGREYLIKVDGNTGSYRIAFSDTFRKPGMTITPLDEGVWTSGSIIDTSSGGDGEQWFKFTATASTQYIHMSYGSMTSMYIQLYDLDDTPVGSRQFLHSYTSGPYPKVTLSVTYGREYLIKVDGNTGSYRIAFSDTFRKPGMTITSLSEGVWANGNIVSTSSGGDGEQWFKFTATASTQYIHIGYGSSGYTYIQLYDLDDTPVGSRQSLYTSSSDAYVGKLTQSVTYGREYLIKVDGITGTFKIAFSDSTAQPSS